ncbi:MAG: hypothetical protein GX977_02035 [Firmicutes bacterium]|nr:hypothetical protein [Bacillota bacterium]
MDSQLSSKLERLMITVWLLLCLVMTGGAQAEAKESGGDPLPVLRFGTTARIWGMGNAGVAAAKGVEGLYYNPAALATVRQPELSVSHSSLWVDTDLSFMAAALPITDQGGIGAGLLLVSSPNIPGTGEGDVLEDHFDYLQAVAYIGGAMAVDDVWGAGITIKGLFGELEEDRCRGYSLEGGLRYQVNQSLTVSLLARDLVGELTWTTGLKEAIPTQILGGAAMSFYDGKLLVSGQSDLTFKDWGFGAEYSIGEHIQLRGGYVKDSITAGAGLAVGNTRLDYSWVGHEMGGTHRVSFGVDF